MWWVGVVWLSMVKGGFLLKIILKALNHGIPMILFLIFFTICIYFLFVKVKYYREKMKENGLQIQLLLRGHM